jgi:hypothetical protein
MVIYFTEEDLVSFGTYMISAERRKSIEGNPNFEDGNLEIRLGTVNDADIQNWALLLAKNQQG